jgi:N-acetylglucosamine-6-phosphate deacetylase
MSAILLDGATLVDRRPVRIVLMDGRIAAIDDAETPLELSPGGRRIDVAGLLAVPGFIDLQVNGARGSDITLDPGSMWAVGEPLARHGVTAFLATIVSSEPGRIDEAIDAWRQEPASAGAVPIGLHLEGPYLSPARAGAHRSDQLRSPDPAEASGWTPEAGVRMVTLAPELPGALDLVGELSARGIVVAAGHTDADAATGRAAVDAGVRYATHLLNAMRPLDHHAPSLASALLDDDRVTIGLIADGLHVAPEMLAVVRRTIGPGRLSLVSDAMAGLDMPPGRMRLGGAEVVVGADGARLEDGTLAGSIAGLDAGLRMLVAATGCDLSEVVASVTSTPAELLRLGDGRGRLEVGGRADIALLTPELEVVATLVGGEVAWSAEPARWA